MIINKSQIIFYTVSVDNDPMINMDKYFADINDALKYMKDLGDRECSVSLYEHCLIISREYKGVDKNE